MLDGDHRPASPRRLPFSFQAHGGVGRLSLVDLIVGPLVIQRLELEIADLGTDPGASAAERFQRRRTRLRHLVVRVTSRSLEDRLEQVRKHLAGIGVTQISARLNDGFISVRARTADGLAAADLSFHILLVNTGAHLRALASTVRVHGHLPTPGPVIADRIQALLFGTTETAGVIERPHARGLCDVEIDLVGALLWHLMPPSGWRLPAIANVELTSIRIGRAAVEIAYGPAGTRTGELGVRPAAHQLAAAHDLMHSVDQQLRDGHLEDAMRGYRALLAAGGPDQPLVLERILALAAARPAWFFDGLELSRQALGRWPSFPPAHAALASITLAQGDAREAAAHLSQLAQLASAEGDDDQAALSALAGARLLRVLEPRAATQLYQLALEHDPGSAEAADSLADRLADEQRWPELVRLVRARAVITEDPARAVQLRLRLADVFVHQLGDPASAQQELAAARELAPDDPAVQEMTATILASRDPGAAVDAWHEVGRLAEARGDHRAAARAWAILGDLLAKGAVGAAQALGASSGAAATVTDATAAWRRSLELDPLQADALSGLASAAALQRDHATAAEMYERLRGLGLPQHAAARYELQLARSLVAMGRTDEARSSLRRATVAGGETAAEAHAVLAEIADATFDRDHAAAELDTAIESLVDLASDDLGEGERLYTRAAELAISRASLLDRAGQAAAASADYQRAHQLAAHHAPELARDAARTLLERSGDDAGTERRWIDAVLATRPPAIERAVLLVRRAEVRQRERVPDLAAAIADLHEALRITEISEEPDALATDTRRRAYQLEAELLAQSGDQRARAQALAALARMAERAADRVEVETAAAAAWLAADEPAAALPHGTRAHAGLRPDVPAALRRDVLVTLGEAAWRQRAWPDVIRAYKGLIDDPGAEAPRLGTFRYRLAVAGERTGDPELARATLHPLVVDPEAARAISPELRSQALRLYADLAERAGDLGAAAAALESFAALAVDSSATARADAVYRAGELFRRAERTEDAIRCLEVALRISDVHLPALDALEAVWRDRGDLERVAVILGRKVAATARHPARQKPLLSRLGDLQAQLGRPEVALATHQRALEIDPTWRPSLRFVSQCLRDAGQIVAAASGLAQLAGDLPGDPGVDIAVVVRERQLAAAALAQLVAGLDEAQLDAVREVALPALERVALEATPRPGAGEDRAGRDARSRTATGEQRERAAAALDEGEVAAAIARFRGEVVPNPNSVDEDTNRSRAASPPGGARSLRDAAARSRAAGKLDDALATLETANHVNPGDPALVRDLVELATQLDDHTAAARHLVVLSELVAGPRRGDVLLELADVCYDRLDDHARGRAAMRAAAEAFGTGSRRDSTLRMLATEAATNLAWDVAVDALTAIAPEKRTKPDQLALASALRRIGRDGDAIALIEDATSSGRFEDGGELLSALHADVERKAALAKVLEERAATAAPGDAAELRAEARVLREMIESSAEPAETIAIDDPDAHTRPRTTTELGLGARDKTPAAATADEPPRPETGPPPRPPAIEMEGAPEQPSASTAPTDTEGGAFDQPSASTAPTDTEGGAFDQPSATTAPTDTEGAPEQPSTRTARTDAEPAIGRIKLVSVPTRTVTERHAGVPLDHASGNDQRPPGDSPPAADTASAPGEPPARTAPTDVAAPTDMEGAPQEPLPRSAPGARWVGAERSPASAPPPPDEATDPISLTEHPPASAQPPPADHPLASAQPEAPANDRVLPTEAPASDQGPPTASAQPSPDEHLPAHGEPRAARSILTLDEDAGFVSVTDPAITSSPVVVAVPIDAFDSDDFADDLAVPIEAGHEPSVVIAGTEAETAIAVAAAAAFADRDRLIAAWREHPDDPAVLLALLAHLGSREPVLRREVLDEASRTSAGRALAIALHELALVAREHRDPARATALWVRAHDADPNYPPIWMMLADALAAADDVSTARELYEKVAASDAYDATRRGFAADRADALGRDDSIVSGEIEPRATVELNRAQSLLASDDRPGAIAAAERAASAATAGDTRALELLEKLYLDAGDVTAASEAIGRQLVAVADPAHRAQLWRRRARLYREALGRDAEAYRCLKEAQACSPADPEIAYQLRVAAMVRGEWALAASLLYREIAASTTPRDRGALHLELALIYEERLDDDAQAQVNYEQALAFDPTIPAAKLPLARRYDVIGRYADAARLYEEAATTARAGDRAALLAAAARARTAATDSSDEPDLEAQLDRANAMGDLDGALELAHQLWRHEPGHAAAFRVLANVHRASGDLPALTDLTAVRVGNADTPDERATAWLEVARLAEELGALEQAARAYDLALIEDPGHAGALDARGALAFRIGDYAAADMIYRDLSAGESVLGDDELALRRSMIAEHLGRDSEALDHARAAAKAAPGRRDVVLRVQELGTRIGDLDVAIDAARLALDLVPLDDDDAQLATHFALVELQRQRGDLPSAIGQLERILRDHPLHSLALELLAELHIARGDWPTATRYLYQLVPLAPTAPERAERLYRLGEAVLVHLGDIDRADDVFLRASDLDPSHVPTLRRLLDVYWRADDPGALVEVATELADKNALGNGPTSEAALAHALVAAALVGDTLLAQRIGIALGDDTPYRVVGALAELAGREGRLQLASASTAVAELARRGLLDLAKMRSAAAGTPVADLLARAP